MESARVHDIPDQLLQEIGKSLGGGLSDEPAREWHGKTSGTKFMIETAPGGAQQILSLMIETEVPLAVRISHDCESGADAEETARLADLALGLASNPSNIDPGTIEENWFGIASVLPYLDYSTADVTDEDSVTLEMIARAHPDPVVRRKTSMQIHSLDTIRDRILQALATVKDDTLVRDMTTGHGVSGPVH